MTLIKPDRIGQTGSGTSSQSGLAADSLLIAHFSDPHLSSLLEVSKRDLLNKRVLGYLSWRTRRRTEHLSDVLAALVRDLDVTRPEHIVITGDLTHLGLPSEFWEVSEWLQRLGPPAKITVIPGNHDAYVRTSWERTFALWVPYMISDRMEPAEPVARSTVTLFPSVRVRGSVALIGISTARPSPPLFATGSLGRDQLEALEDALVETYRQGLFRTLLVHHPPLPGSEKWRKRLTDSASLCSILTRHGVELVLHGHSHRPTLAQLRTATGIAPVIGVASASAIGRRPGRRAQYNLYQVTRSDRGWHLRISVRGFSPLEGRFVAEAEREVFLSGPDGKPLDLIDPAQQE